jgi:hypothetical protein
MPRGSAVNDTSRSWVVDCAGVRADHRGSPTGLAAASRLPGMCQFFWCLQSRAPARQFFLVKSFDEHEVSFHALRSGEYQGVAIG